MLLKLTAQDTLNDIYVQTENIVAFRPDENGTELLTNNSNLFIYVEQTPEEITEIWGTVVNGKTNGS